MYCENCGKRIPDESQFCPECGAPVVNNRPPQERAFRQPPQKSLRPVNHPKKKGNKGIIAVIAAVAAVAVLVVTIIVNPLGIGDISKKFQKTSTAMTNDWNGAIGVYGNANSSTLRSIFASSDLDDSWDSSDWTKYHVSSVDYNLVASDDVTYGVFVLFKCQDSAGCNSLVNDCISDSGDFDLKNTGKGWTDREDGYIVQLLPKKNYAMICIYSDKLASQSEKFIDKVGF